LRSLGFGLERLGLLVLRAPRLFALAALALTIAGASTLPQTSFDGRLVDILSDNQSFQAYAEIKDGFRDASHDAFLMIRGDDLVSAEGMEALRFFHLDLALAEEVRAVYSVFSLGTFDVDTGSFLEDLPGTFTSDAEAESAVADLVASEPAAAALIAPDQQTAIVVATLDAPRDADNDVMAARVAELEATIDAYLPDRFSVTLTGLPAIQATVADSLASDQWRLALFGFVIGAVIGFVIFRSLIAALACATPAGVAVLWLLGVINALGIEINFLFILLPSLALILALVDSIVFFFHWQSANAENGDLRGNLRASIKRIGPASAMTSVTTALAFASFAYAQNPALHTLAWLGVGSVAIAFLSFIVVLPLLCLVIARFTRTTARARPSFSDYGSPIGRVADKAALPRAALAAVVTLVLGVIHFQVSASFEIERYLPPGDAVLESETALGEVFGGTVPLYALVDMPDGASFSDPAARERVAQVAAIFDEVLGPGATASLADVWAAVPEEDIDAVADLMAGAEGGELDRILSDDRRSMLVTRQLPSVIPGDEVDRMVSELDAAFVAAGLGNAVALTGFPVLSSVEIPALVEELRFGLIIAVALAVLAIAFATRSLGIALACLIPNILPILAVEAVLWALGFDHDLTSVVALTIAFGIGIDNAIHVINMYRVNRATMEPREALTRAVRTVGPALMASTAILGLSYLATQISAMPSIGLLGQLIIATLVAALIANLVFLPSFIALLDRGFRRLRRNLAPARSGVT